MISQEDLDLNALNQMPKGTAALNNTIKQYKYGNNGLANVTNANSNFANNVMVRLNNGQIQYFNPNSVMHAQGRNWTYNPEQSVWQSTSFDGSGPLQMTNEQMFNPNSSYNNMMSGLAMGMQGLSALGGLANAYMGYKNYQLAKDQFKFSKAAANRNLANQAKLINNTYDNAAQVAAGMIGGGSYDPTTRQGSYGLVDQATVDRYAENARKKHVDGSPIG